jgi:MscS family membrane protein
VAPRFYKRIAHLPLRSSLDIQSWTRTIPQVTGPMIPRWIPANIPPLLQEVWQKTPVWKVIAVALMTILAAVPLIVFHRMANRNTAKDPLHIGDFCSFGDKTGIIESIGVRSTKLRALDRTLISIPNAALADMQLINYAKCDRMLIMTTIGLRYETEPDQLRYVLVKIREMLHAHPRIDSETIRVRFFEYGASSLDIQMRIYALTRDWNEFFAIREDVRLRINDIVRKAGTGFAFPSQTMYFSRDQGLDEKSRQTAVEAVQARRRSGQLPFPRLSRERIEGLQGTLDYPPRGSVEAGSPPEDWGEAAEPLSTTPEPAEGTEEDNEETNNRGGGSIVR